MSALGVDLELVQKYNVPGPRYTSYPPATRFSDQLPVASLLDKIRANKDSDRDLSLYFHLPFCQTLCWFCGCTTVITTDQGASSRYLDYLGKEMALVEPLLNTRRRVVQLHFGGGTPTFLTPDEIRRLGGMIRARFNVAPDAEAGVEIDPRRLTRDHLVALREAGFNRASIGVQDHNAAVQKAVHRIQPFAQTKLVVDWIRQVGFGSLNLDLIYGLPHQTVSSFEQTLGEVLQLRPDRLAVFSYAHVPWVKPAQKILEAGVLPGPEVKLQLLKLTIETLTGAGYVYIGLDHFARADDELAVAQRQKTLQRNFQGYSTRGGADIHAFGMSAISQIPEAYWQNEKDLARYYGALDEGRVPITRGCLVTGEDAIRRETIMRLMCDLSLDYAAMSRRLDIDFASHFEREIESLGGLEADGLVHRSRAGLEITDAGRLFIRNVAMCFDNTLAPAGERKHSRTI